MATPISRRGLLKLGGATLGSLALSRRLPVGASEQPSFLLILSDDARYDTIDFMPRTRDHIFGQGATFTNAFCTTPTCGPSRATILTGMYTHNHGVLDNPYPFDQPHLINHLHDSGYYTGLVGKGVNSWCDEPRPEFDFWAVPTTSDYFDPVVNFNGELIQHQGYRTYIMRGYALQFIRNAMQLPGPFVLLFWPFAPHAPAEPAPGDDDLYPNLPPHRPPNFNEADVSDKPLWLQARPLLSEEEIAECDALRLRQLQCMHSLDKAIASLLAALDRSGRLDPTVVMYLSDNGYKWGEHRLTGKKIVYQPSSRTAFGLRYPPLVPEPLTETSVVGNLDIAATVYELAGLPIPPEVNGRSLVRLLQGIGRWRKDLLIEAWPWDSPRYSAVHGQRFVYVETEGDLSELYDLAVDPHQLENQIDSPIYAPLVTKLSVRLARLREE